MRNRSHSTVRRLERRLKLLMIAALGRLMHPPSARVAPDWGARPHRILFLRYDHVGDMVLVTGILHAIKRAQPQVTIDVLASVRNAAVLDGNPDVQTVYRADKSRPWSFLLALARVRRVAYDAVLDSMVTGPSLTSTLIMWASGARHRIGVGGRGNDFALTLPVARVPGAIHYIDHSAALLRPFGIDPLQNASTTALAQWRPRIYLTSAEIGNAQTFWRSVEASAAPRSAVGRRRRLAVNVSAGAPARCWPEERFVATIRWLRERFPDVLVLVLGTPADESLKRRIGWACAVPVDETANARQMMGLVATCDFVLTPDTSVTHVASAFGKPAVAMFAGSDGRHWGPYGTAGEIVCTPARTLASLTIEPVLQALERMLSAELAGGIGRAAVGNA